MAGDPTDDEPAAEAVDAPLVLPHDHPKSGAVAPAGALEPLCFFGCGHAGGSTAAGTMGPSSARATAARTIDEALRANNIDTARRAGDFTGARH